MNTFQAGAIFRFPAMIILTQNASDVIFKFGLDFKKGWVERSVTQGTVCGAIH
jgi:hypothetical protein